MNTNKIKKGDKNDKDEPKIKKKDQGQILKLFLFSIQLIIIVLLFFTVNGSLVYFIKEASLEVINRVLPSKCDDYPYGTKNLNPCNNKNVVNSDILNQFVVNLIKQQNDGVTNNTNNTNKCNEGASIPYKWYRKNSDSILHNYLNWFLVSLAETQVDLHGHIKNFMSWINGLTVSTYSILMVVSVFLFVLSLPIIYIYTLGSLVIKQLTSFWKHGIIEMILIILSGFFIWSLDLIISSFNVIKLLFELLIRPIFTKSQREVIMNIVRKENVLMGYVFGFMFLQILYKVNMNKHMEKPLKIIPTVIFFLIVSIHFIKYMYGIVSKIGGSERNKCT